MGARYVKTFVSAEYRCDEKSCPAYISFSADSEADADQQVRTNSWSGGSRGWHCPKHSPAALEREAKEKKDADEQFEIRMNTPG